ncbi:hypothetical protein IHQ68_19085 [Chelatococcus sambhunathii]|uniref:YXWGXW repeat (2 copies) n=2 Tax=Chelatococcus sambhunathii TaxID=363953 RepID=A0ABU1DKU2_9HYPH|nr:hypothetical protein [Chelatococcus sambhunathii]
MIRTYALSAAVLAGGLMAAATAPASAAPASAAGLASAKLDAAQGEIMNVGWRHRRWRGYGYGYYWAPRVYVRPRAYYYAPRYRRCWIDSWGYRVCG